MSHEYEIDASEFLVLLSDKASNFIYANATYLKASGYSWEELRGTITARMMHKDTPMQVQLDMIRTLRAKRPWTGIIKNQRKNGDYYWLRLNISPLYSRGAFAGSLLVHSKPTRDEIARYEPMYRAMREGKTLILSHGAAVRDNLAGRTLDRIRNRGLTTRIWGTMAILNAVVSMGLIAAGGSVGATWVAWAASLACTALLGAHLSRSIVAPLRDVLNLANRIAAGDLGTHGNSTRSDEIGALIRAGVGEISQGVTNLDRMTQQNASLVRDNTSFAESLRSQSERLAQAVAVFKLSESENLELFNATQMSAAEGTERSMGLRAA